jgi:hypothetical protein
VNEDALRSQLLHDKTKPKPYALTEVWFANALKNLSVDSVKRNAWLTFRDETVRQWREESYAYGKKEVRAKEERTRIWSLDLSDNKAKRLLDPQFKGEKAGDIKHVQAIVAQRKAYWLNGWITRVDTGETDESVADLYVTPTLSAPDTEGAKGYIDPKRWNYERSFAVEVESYPQKHWDRVRNNYERNKKMGFPTAFILPTEGLATELKKKLENWGATVVANSARFEPGHSEMAAVDVAKILGNSAEESVETQQAPEEDSYDKGERRQQPLVKKTNEMSQSEANIDSRAEAAQHLIEGRIDEAEQENHVTVERRDLILGLANSGWWFTLKQSGGKSYLYARKGRSENKSLGCFDEEAKQIIEKLQLKVRGFND